MVGQMCEQADRELGQTARQRHADGWMDGETDMDYRHRQTETDKLRQAGGRAGRWEDRHSWINECSHRCGQTDLVGIRTDRKINSQK